MDDIGPSPSSGWPLPLPLPGGRPPPPPTWDPHDATTERTRRLQQRLAELQKQLLFARTALDAQSFRSILAEIERVKDGLDDLRYQKAAPALPPSPPPPPPAPMAPVKSAVPSAFSQSDDDDDDDVAAREGESGWRKRFKFASVGRFWRRLRAFRPRRRSRARNGVTRGAGAEARNE